MLTDQDPGGRIANWSRRPECLAAIVNAGVTLTAPAALAAYADYTWDAVRPFAPTLVSSAARAVPVLLAFIPVSLLVAWRTYVHARAYRRNPRTIWRGPLESAAIGGGIALVIMVGATAGTWAREPPHLVAGYIAIYVFLTALIGLVLGVVLAAAALVVVHLSRRSVDQG